MCNIKDYICIYASCEHPFTVCTIHGSSMDGIIDGSRNEIETTNFFFFLTICRQLSAFLSCLLLSFLLYSFSSSSCSRKVHHKRTCCRRKHPVEKKTRNRLTLSSPSNCSSLSPYLLLFSIRKKNRKKRCSQTQSHSLFPSVFSLSLFSVRKKNKKKV